MCYSKFQESCSVSLQEEWEMKSFLEAILSLSSQERNLFHKIRHNFVECINHHSAT